MKHEAFPFHRGFDGEQLRRVGLDGEHERGRVDYLVGVKGLGVPGEVAFHKAVDNLAVAQLFLV